MALSHPWRWWAVALTVILVGSVVASQTSPALTVSIVAVAVAVAVSLVAGFRHVRSLRARPFLPPRQLPAAPPAFVGRDEELRTLRETLLNGGPRPTVNIYGVGGIGKTALAIALAQSVADRFPDGQLYLALGGATRHTTKPAFPAEVLSDFVYALQRSGEDIPTGTDELLERYRALTARRKVLLLLDDAPGSSQITPLLPAGHGCAAIVTSRTPLDGLAVTRGYELGPLSEDAAKSLLTRITKTADPVVLHQLAKTCARIPLALRLAGSAMSHHPKTDFAGALDRAMKIAGGTGKVQPLDAAYGFLTHEERSAFRCISAIDEDAFSPSMFAAAADVEEGVARKLADRLAGALLLERRDSEPLAEPSYAAQDMVRDYAELRAEVEDDSDVRNRRLVRLADARARQNEGILPSEMRRQVFQLEREGSLAKALTSARAALAAAQETEDEKAEWAARAAIAELSAEAGNITEARAVADRATAAPEAATRARAYRCLGHTRRRLHQYAEAIWDLHEALRLAEEAADNAEQARVLSELGIVSALCGPGSAAEAESFCTRAARICELPDPAAQSERGRTLIAHGRVFLYLGNLDDAERTLHAARELTEGEHQSLPLAYVLYWLAQVDLKLGDPAASSRHITRAIDLFADIRHYYGLARCRTVMADIALARGDAAAASQLLQEALETFHSCGDPTAEAEALEALAGTYRKLGRLDEAAEAQQNAAATTALLSEEGASASPPAQREGGGPLARFLRRATARTAAR